MAEQDRKLEGFLLKQGEGTLGRAFKKRWFSQKGTCLYYYRNKSDTNTAGFINLAEAISCHPTEGVKGKFLFQINTPRRIWHLEAESETAMQYWVDGIKAIFNKLREEEERGRQFDRRSVRLETMENRVRDLETRDQLLKQALELACSRLGVPAEQILTQVDKGALDTVKDLLQGAAPASTSTSSSDAAASHSESHSSEPAAASSEAAHAETTTTTTSEPAAAETPGEHSEPAAVATEEHKEAAAAAPAEEHKEASSSSDAAAAAAPAEEHKEAAAAAVAAASAEEHKETAAAAPAEEPKAAEAVAATTAAEEPGKSAAASGDKKDAPAQSDKRFKAKVLYDYSAQQDYEMTIHTNEIITVLSKHGNGWWLGASAEGKQGYFPGSYVEPIAE